MSDTGGGSRLFQINRNRRRIEALEDVVQDAAGTKTLRSYAELEAAYPNVAGLHTLDPDTVYYIEGPIIMPAGRTLAGHNIVMIGNTAFQTIIAGDSATALLASDADGYINLQGMVFSNIGGPLLNLDLGQTAFSILVMNQVFFTGLGSGSAGVIVSADRVTISGSFFVDLAGGIEFTGEIGEISMTNCAITPTLGATDFIGLEVADTATLDIALFSVIRFDTANATDRAMKFGTSAAYIKSMQIQGCTLRGSGQFLDAAGLLKTDPLIISAGNGAALLDSVFAGAAGFTGNTFQTVISASSTFVRVGNGTPAHLRFDGGQFTERFTIADVETDLQEIQYDGLVARTFDVTLTATLARTGGGTQTHELAFQLEGVTLPASRRTFEVSGAGASVEIEVVVELDSTEALRVVIANNSTTDNIVVESAQWSVRRLL